KSIKIAAMSETYWSAEIEPEPADPLLRPVWEDEPDDAVGAGLVLPRAKTSPADHLLGWLPADALTALLVPLCDAQDALARLDARAAAAPAPVRDGLCARMAFTEAAGWLAHAHTWV